MRTSLRSAALLGVLALPASAGSLSAAICDGISSAAASPLTTVRIPGTYLRPLFLTAPPGDVTRLFIVEQDGTIRIVKNGVVLPTAFLDVGALTTSPGDGGGFEEGLLGLAFAPDYATSGTLYVYHTDTTGANNLLVRYQRDAVDPDRVDTASRQVLATFAHPTFDNHNGGMLAFAPDDGRLYVGTGDGGNACDPFDNSQNLASPLGKLLRFDLQAQPPTFEIWARGLRNPWRFAFDRATSDLYVGDVGQYQWEEIDYRPAPRSAGENYGWDLYEGSMCPNPSCGTIAPCNSIPSPILPLIEYFHTDGTCSVTGGYVYRGCRMPALHGRYFYGDYCAAIVKSVVVSGGLATNPQDNTAELGGAGAALNFITSFGEDARGELYILDQDGEIYQIVPILPNLEVSGLGAAPFLPGTGDWAWEDLQSTSGHPIAAYRVLRSPGNGSGTFDCVHQGPSPSWIGGDPTTPAVGGLFSYLVIAVNASGTATSPGKSTGGDPRSVSAVPCPP